MNYLKEKGLPYDEKRIGNEFARNNAILFNWLNKHKWQIKDLGEGTIIEVIKIEKYCKKTDIPNDLNNAVVWSLDVNDHCSNSIKDLEKKYV